MPMKSSRLMLALSLGLSAAALAQQPDITDLTRDSGCRARLNRRRSCSSMRT